MDILAGDQNWIKQAHNLAMLAVAENDNSCWNAGLGLLYSGSTLMVN